jgi:FkbM family methyltransferase
MRFPRHPIQSLQYRLKLARGPSVERPSLKRQALKRFLPEDAVIVEAGAHAGSDTAALAQMLPAAEIHAFEPIPALYERLRRNTAAFSNVRTYPLALGAVVTTKPMWVGGGAEDGSSSLLAPKAHLDVYEEITFEHTVTVNVTTLAAWAEREGINRVDGMWLDMQGYELAALQAAGPLLSTTRALIVEMSGVELYDEAPLWPEVRQWLEEHGFRIEAESWHETGVDGDALAVRAVP